MVLPRYYIGITTELPWYYHGIAVVITWYYHGNNMVLLRNYHGIVKTKPFYHLAKVMTISLMILTSFTAETELHNEQDEI